MSSVEEDTNLLVSKQAFVPEETLFLSSKAVCSTNIVRKRAQKKTVPVFVPKTCRTAGEPWRIVSQVKHPKKATLPILNKNLAFFSRLKNCRI